LCFFYLWHWRGIYSVEFIQVAEKKVLSCKYCPLDVGNFVVVRQPVQSIKQVKGMLFSLASPHSKLEKLLVTADTENTEKLLPLEAIPPSNLSGRVLYVFPN